MLNIYLKILANFGIKLKKTAILLFGSALMSTVAAATFDLTTQTGNLGTASSYVDGLQSVTAYGFDCQSTCALNGSYSSTDLWSDSVYGLGIANSTNHLINTTNFVMFDLQGFDTVTSLKFLPYFIQNTVYNTPEDFFEERRRVSVFGSNTLGLLERQFIRTDVLQDAVFSTLGSYRYLAFTGWAYEYGDQRTSNNYSIASIVTAVPEPETYAMMLAGLGVMGAVARRHKANLTA